MGRATNMHEKLGTEEKERQKENKVYKHKNQGVLGQSNKFD